MIFGKTWAEKEAEKAILYNTLWHDKWVFLRKLESGRWAFCQTVRCRYWGHDNGFDIFIYTEKK